MLAALVSAAVSASPLPNISVQPAGEGFTVKVDRYELSAQARVEQEVHRRAGEACGSRRVRWGKFESVAKLPPVKAPEVPTISNDVRQFTCVAAAPEPNEAAPSDWQPTQADVADAIAVFQDYYAKRDRGNFNAAWSMFRPGVLGDAGSWAEEMRGTNAKLGPGTRRVTGVTWYVNPDGADQPGIYAAVDFVGDFSSVHFYCGYAILHLRAPGSFEITREEQNVFARADGQADPAQLEQMRSAMCRDPN